jgi:hypothetical protein
VFLATLIILAVTEGRPGVGALLRRLGHWRVGFRWYGIALGLPFAVHVLAGILTVLLGAPAPTLAQLPDWSALALTVLLLLAVGGQWEEPGWRGYAQPHLEAGRSALAAALLLGVIGIGWHLPLMLTGLLPWSELLVIPALFIVWAWAYNSTDGSLLIAVLFHLSSNLAGALIPSVFVGSDVAQRSWLFAGLWCAAALAVILLAGPARLSRTPPTPPSTTSSADGATHLDSQAPSATPCDNDPASMCSHSWVSLTFGESGLPEGSAEPARPAIVSLTCPPKTDPGIV